MATAQEIQVKKDQLNKQKQKYENLQKQNNEIQKQNDDLKKQVTVKKAQQLATAQIVAPLKTQTTVQYAKISAPVPVVSGDAKMFIYNKESGNNPARWNSSGCLGLGQACPASKLLAVCPNMDYACEDVWFTSYMTSRYHTWENARAFWLSHRWW